MRALTWPLPTPRALHPRLTDMLNKYDAPWSLPLVAPRPLLVINGELDPRCPLEGVQAALGPAAAAYAAAGAPEALRLFVDPGVGHACTPAMWAQAHVWLDAHLLPQQPAPG